MGKYLKTKTKNSEISEIKSGVVGATTDRFQRIENKVDRQGNSKAVWVKRDNNGNYIGEKSTPFKNVTKKP